MKRNPTFTCVDLTGFDPRHIVDVTTRFSRAVVVSRNGSGALVESAVKALKFVGMPEDRIRVTTAAALDTEALHATTDDLSLASRFLHEHRHELRYVADVERWICWNGVLWRGLYDKTGSAKAKAMLQRFMAKVGRETAGEMISTEAARSESTKEDRERVFRAAQKLEADFRSAARLTRVWQHTEVMAQDSDQVTLQQADLNRDPYLLNCPNCMVDLRTLKTRRHDPAELCTAVTRVPYDADAKCPTFGWFLAEAQPNEENRHYLRRRSGLLLIGTQRSHVFLVDIGLEGRNGKGVLAGTLQWVMGDYATTVDSSLILVGRNERHPTTIASLVHKRFTWCDETRATRSLDGARIKQFTGGATRKAYFMRSNEFEYEPSDTLLLTTNYMPRFQGEDPAFMARVQMLPWTVTFRGREDEDLPDRLKVEGEGILAWAVRGAAEYLADGLQPPPDVLARTEEERREHDPIGSWLDEHIVEGSVAAGDRVLTKAAVADFLSDTSFRPPPDLDFARSFGRQFGAWVQAKKRDSGWDIRDDYWRDPLYGKGRGWAGVRYESD